MKKITNKVLVLVNGQKALISSDLLPHIEHKLIEQYNAYCVGLMASYLALIKEHNELIDNCLKLKDEMTAVDALVKISNELGGCLRPSAKNKLNATGEMYKVNLNSIDSISAEIINMESIFKSVYGVQVVI